MKNKWVKSFYPIVFLVFAGITIFVTGQQFYSMHREEPLYPAKSLTKIDRLGRFNPHLKGTSGDAKIYYFDSKVPGGTVLILGGTHPNEPAGYMTAYLIIENIGIKKGRVIVLPRANNSALTHTEPQEGDPQYFTIQGKHGPRTFRFGSRVTNPIDQWPDPEIYLHHPSGQKLAGSETRNLNRSYPGKKNGTLTQKIAWAIVELIKQEKVDLAFDLHEAAPEYPVVNAIVAPKRSQDIASVAVMELEMENIEYSLEPSPVNFHGLSHREWQDFTQAFPILMETANPIQGRLRGKTDARLLLSGQDKMYLLAAKLGELHVPYDSRGIPLKVRIGRHLAGIEKIVAVFSKNFPDKAIVLTNLPSYDALIKNDIGFYFK
jgi:hypothetical protein